MVRIIHLLNKLYFKEPPVITSVEQTSENTVLLKWNVDNNYVITRYRILFKDLSKTIKEWPGKYD